MAGIRPTDVKVERAGPADLARVRDILARAFHDDPVAEWVIPDASRREAVLRARFETVLGVFGKGEIYVLDDRTGAALWVPPGTKLLDEDETEEFGRRMEAASGEYAGRFSELDARKKEHHPETPCFYLPIMGVVPERQGRGLGSALLAPGLRRCDADGSPAYLEATSTGSRRLYQRHGFETVGEIRLPDGPSLWPMWREQAAS